jgi:hypothetical protein
MGIGSTATVLPAWDNVQNSTAQAARLRLRIINGLIR